MRAHRNIIIIIYGRVIFMNHRYCVLLGKNVKVRLANTPKCRILGAEKELEQKYRSCQPLQLRTSRRMPIINHRHTESASTTTMKLYTMSTLYNSLIVGIPLMRLVRSSLASLKIKTLFFFAYI